MPVRLLGSLVLVGFLLAAREATAQCAIAGQAKDASGAVVPGVTVEAASAALIEKVRTVVTDAQGLYTIVDLRPGNYTVTFTLTGFSTVIRQGIDLPSNFTATVNAEMIVGALEETLTVSGQAPTVDTGGASTTQVISRDLVDAVPTAHDSAGWARPSPASSRTSRTSAAPARWCRRFSPCTAPIPVTRPASSTA